MFYIVCILTNSVLNKNLSIKSCNFEFLMQIYPRKYLFNLIIHFMEFYRIFSQRLHYYKQKKSRVGIG